MTRAILKRWGMRRKPEWAPYRVDIQFTSETNKGPGQKQRRPGALPIKSGQVHDAVLWWSLKVWEPTVSPTHPHPDSWSTPWVPSVESLASTAAVGVGLWVSSLSASWLWGKSCPLDVLWDSHSPTWPGHNSCTHSTSYEYCVVLHSLFPPQFLTIWEGDTIKDSSHTMIHSTHACKV